MSNNIDRQILDKIDEMEEERCKQMPEIIATTKGQSLEELRKEMENMGTSSDPQRESNPIIAVNTQADIVERINNAINNILLRAEVITKKLPPRDSVVNAVWEADESKSSLANAQSNLIFELECVSGRLNNLYESLDL